MINFEAYKNEIIQKYKYLRVTTFETCKTCLMDAINEIYEKHNTLAYPDKLIYWLFEEYKEPLLSDKAKNYLKSIIEPSKSIEIKKVLSDDAITNKLICVTDDGVIIILYKTGTKFDEYFKTMELDKSYTMEELELC